MLKRVNAHAKRRELSTSVLALFLSIPQLSETRIKSGRSVLCPYVCCYVTIRSYALKGETLISMAKIVIISEIQNDKT